MQSIQPNFFVFLALGAFVPVVLGLTWRLGPRRGALASMFCGWLLLPWFDAVGGSIPLLHTKAMYVSGVVALAVIVFDGARVLRFRPRSLDVPFIATMAIPPIASLYNGYPLYDAMSALFRTSMVTGVPYLLGRIYLGNRRGVEEFAKAMVLSSAAYIPLCLWEIRMSPQLHRTIYGFYQHEFIQTIRPGGGYRPMVFMYHGLMVGLFMASGSLVAYWLWRTRAWRAVGGVPLVWIVLLLVATTVLIKSEGAILLLGAGIAVLEGTRRFRTPLFVALLLAIPPTYCTARIQGWGADELIRWSAVVVGPDRATSLQSRFYNEGLLIDRALKRAWLGWGTWGSSRVADEEGRDVAVTDSRWIITFGWFGLAGLLSLWLTLALPVATFLRRFPARLWGDPRLAAAAALVVVALVGMIDDLLNAVGTWTAPGIAGCIVSLVVTSGIHRAPPTSAAARARRTAHFAKSR